MSTLLLFWQMQKRKMVFSKFQQSLIPHTAQLFGKRTPIHTEIICQLLPIKGNEKTMTPLL